MSNLFTRALVRVCMCIVISSQVNIEPGLSLFNRWCYSSVVLFRFLLLYQIIKRLVELRGDGDRSLLYFFFFSYRLCHYNKRLNNRRTTRIVIGKWLLYHEFCFCICSYTISLFSFFVYDESSLNVHCVRRSTLKFFIR